MRRLMKIHSVNKERPCDICGDVGFAHCLATCSICHLSHEHIYCMRRNLLEVPKEWFCEACPSSRNMVHRSWSSQGPGRIANEDEQISYKKRKTLCAGCGSPKMPDSSNTRCIKSILGSPCNSALSLPPTKNYVKVVETGKVKFLNAEDVVRLESGTSKVKAYAVRSGLNSQVGSSSTLHNPILKRTPISVADASKRFSQKEITFRSSRPSTPAMLGSVKKSTSLQQEVVKTSLQDIPTKEKSNEAKLLDKRAGKVPIISNGEYVCGEPLDVMLPPKKVRTSLTNTEAFFKEQNESSQLVKSKPNVLAKSEELPNHHAINHTWKGSFEILGKVPPGEFYEGLRAHPPGKVSRKAYEFSKGMPRMLQFKVLPRSDVWSEIFHIDYPTGDDIALYFLPGDFSRSKEKYHCLLDFIEMKDLAMWTCLNGVELIIFTSRQLPMDSQRINMKFFLWGVFRSLKGQLLCSSLSLGRSQQENHVSLLTYGNGGDSLNVTDGNGAEIVDMEIDMVGGRNIGRIDYPVERPNSRVQFKVHNQKGKYPISSELDFHNYLDSCKNDDEVGRSPNVVFNVHSGQSTKGTGSPISKVKREESTDFGTPGFRRTVTSDFGAPPGFCRPVSSDVARNGRMPTVARNLELPPGFSKPLALKERVDPSEACGKKEKAYPSEASDKKEKSFIFDANARSCLKKENTSHSYPAKRVFKESSFLSQKLIRDSESPDLPFISRQIVVNRYVPKNYMAPDLTLSAEKSNVKTEHKQFKTDSMKCKLNHYVKKEPVEEIESRQMLSLSRYKKDGQHRVTGI